MTTGDVGPFRLQFTTPRGVTRDIPGLDELDDTRSCTRSMYLSNRSASSSLYLRRVRATQPWHVCRTNHVHRM